MRSLLLLAVVAAAGGSVAIHQLPAGEAAAAGQAPPVVVRTQEIQSISLEGERLPLADLRARLRTQPGDQLDDRRLAADRAALEAELVGRGHLAARVEPANVVFGTGGGAWVTFDMDKGPMFRLRKVTVTGATARDAGVVTIAPGDQAIADRIDRARETLAETLGRRSRPHEVTVALEIDHASAEVDVVLAVR